MNEDNQMKGHELTYYLAFSDLLKLWLSLVKFSHHQKDKETTTKLHKV